MPEFDESGVCFRVWQLHLRGAGVAEGQNSLRTDKVGKSLFIQKNGIFTRDEVREIMFGLLKGLRCLEKHNIMHRDLKP